MIGAEQRGAKLDSKRLAGTDLTNAGLEEASLHVATYDSTTTWPDGFDPRGHWALALDGDLGGADLRGVDLSGLNTRSASLFGALYDETTIWPSGYDQRASVAIGPGADLRGRDMRPVEAALREASLRDAIYDLATQSPTGFAFATCGAFGPGAAHGGGRHAGKVLRGICLRDTEFSRPDPVRVRPLWGRLAGRELSRRAAPQRDPAGVRNSPGPT